VAAEYSGDPRLSDAGVTILEIWEGGRYRRFSAHARPCQMAGRSFTEGVWRGNRERTDRAFLKACDRLLQYEIAVPRPWKPNAVQLLIGAMDGSGEQQVQWPKTWPPPPTALKPKSAVPLCVPVGTESSDFSNTLIAARWGDIGRTALLLDANTSAVIWDWYFDLPAEIPMVNESGEIEGGAGNSCREVARP
jgi:hypothetical protein